MNLGTAPNELGWFARFSMPLITRPEWMDRDDEKAFAWFLGAEGDLKKNGIVVPGVIVQANELLFQPGKMDHPGEILFSLSPEVDFAALRSLAFRLYDLKGQLSNDPEEKAFSSHLSSEIQRTRGLKVPKTAGAWDQTYLSSTIFYRAHLPGRVLRPSVFPVLVSPTTYIAVVLPFKHWTENGRKLYEAFLHAE